MHASWGAGLLALGLTSAACGGESTSPPDLGPLALEIVYQGSEHELPLLEVKLHGAPDDYRWADNLLAAPLYDGQTLALDEAQLSEGQHYLTVVRKLYDLPDSDLVALTSAEPLYLWSGRYVVWVLDEAFRFFDPVDNR